MRARIGPFECNTSHRFSDFLTLQRRLQQAFPSPNPNPNPNPNPDSNPSPTPHQVGVLQRRVVAEREAAATRLRLTEQVCYLVITPMTAATRLRLTEQARGVLYRLHGVKRCTAV